MLRHAGNYRLRSFWSFQRGGPPSGVVSAVLQGPSRRKREGAKGGERAQSQRIEGRTNGAVSVSGEAIGGIGGYQRDITRDALERGKRRLEEVCRNIKNKRDQVKDNDS